MSEAVNAFETKEEPYDAELYINQNILTISLKEDIRTSKEKRIENMTNTT